MFRKRHRPLLSSLAYRMLGSVIDAEDIVQEPYLSWRGTDEKVRSLEAYLSVVVTRLFIDSGFDAPRYRRFGGRWMYSRFNPPGSCGEERDNG